MGGRLLAILGLLAGTVSGAAAHPPEAQPVEVFASALAGPEGLAFTREDQLVVGSTTGELLLFEADGCSTVLADVGESLAGVTVLRDGRILAASFFPSRVWSINRFGVASVFASGIAGPNFIVETSRRRRILVSASLGGSIVDITDGTPVVAATGLAFPNGLALTKVGTQRFLYVAETFGGGGRVSRLPLDRKDNLGPRETVASGFPLADGIAFDQSGNLLVVGGGTFKVILARTGDVRTLSTDPLLDWPSNLAFGRGRFGRHTVYLVNFGPGLGDGTTVVRMGYNHSGARLSR